ncbi:hypothetical protein UFOVP71_356 [uncultured Caudovirales phage]|uniref:Uncharacterized protein n=1 Tax=uncultured Caudovirales phage TaxID=2100421 RepID=A0A6J5TA62_9CAUD|nr:hypothetical protein UFOVP71_356 [uncultured Caudovirales phage]
MTQHLAFDFTQAPERNPEYFYPLALRLDPGEKQQFIATTLVPYREKIESTQAPLMNVGNPYKDFPRTIAATNAFLKPIGLRVHRMTLFLSYKNQTSTTIHCDGTRDPEGKPVKLEARLSYYEIAEAPGAIRWWNNLPNQVTEIAPNGVSQMPVDPESLKWWQREEPKENSFNGYGQSRVSCIADCSEDLRTGRITWADIPAPAFSVVSSCASAILRTNEPHHVIQGDGLRVTVSCQLVFLNGNPTGVWDHIQKNVHLLGA